MEAAMELACLKNTNSFKLRREILEEYFFEVVLCLMWQFETVIVRRMRATVEKSSYR